MADPIPFVGRIVRLTDEAHIPDPDHRTHSFIAQHNSYVEEERVLALEQRVEVLEIQLNAAAEILARLEAEVTDG